MAKRNKGKPNWIKETFDLKPDHRWQAAPGYKIFVADRGAVRFEVPGNWHFEPQTKSFRFLDRKPPKEDCCLEVSFNRLPPVDFSDFPLTKILKDLVEKDERDVLETGEIITVKRQTARIVWTEFKFMDPTEHREAYARICIALGSGIQCLITFDFWVDDAPRLTPVWDNVLRSLTLGLYIRDPLTGTAFPD
ncbi:hypothetical protein K9N68_15115 [Kovacikia minuta CCNUW1]|uniref:hypothetical protein n=1 Tax=Kovacikia minuta TaxID=2931930 RepID=UPI001CCDCB7A|nr:hypothetical protein [Kovacikia minuta]UBF29045.1 hypothetical protein K9N68_15115 [Kovacikia minuta CCNUW1]